MIGTPLPGAAIRVSDPIELDTFTTRPAELRRSSGSIALVTATTANTLVSERWERHGALVMDTDNETNLLLELSEPMELDMGRHGRQSVRTVAA